MARPSHAAAPTPEAWNDLTLDEIYNLRRPDEQALFTILDIHERDLFYLYATGVKLRRRHGGKEIPSQHTILEKWRDADEFDKEPYMVFAERFPDPRLNANNFKLDSGILQQFWESLPQNRRSEFLSLVHGCKAFDRAYRQPYWHQTIINHWNAADTAPRNKFIAYGRWHYNRFLKKPSPRRAPSGYGGHWFIRPMPDAQTSDIKWVNLMDPRRPEEDHRPPGSRWMFEKTICQNPNYTIVPGRAWTQRIIHLFALVSEDHRILKRIVVKIIGAPTLERAEADVDQEFLFQDALSFKNCPSVLDVYGKSVRPRQQLPQLGYIYMDYAPFGDLFGVIQKLQQEPNKQLPEPYLWLIFRNLAEALLLMETGMTMGQDEPAFENGQLHYRDRGRWPPIVNPDIKPMNVMLGEAQSGFYPGFKTAKMIDFGLCFNDNRFETAAAKYAGGHGIGTQDFWPPEQAFPPHELFENEPINVFSEIFNVGLVILSLMEGNERTLTDEELADHGFEHPEDYDKCYSKDLDDLVMKCLEFAPNRRPNLHQLLYRTRIGLERWEKGYGSADKPEADLPQFATYSIDRKEEFLIGQEAPDNWLGMRARKKRTAEEAGLAPVGPVVPAPGGHPARYPRMGPGPKLPPGALKYAQPPPIPPLERQPNIAPLNGQTLDQQRAANLMQEQQGQPRNVREPLDFPNHPQPGTKLLRKDFPQAAPPTDLAARQELIKKAEAYFEEKKRKMRRNGTFEGSANEVDHSRAQEQLQAVKGPGKENDGPGGRKSDPIELSE